MTTLTPKQYLTHHANQRGVMACGDRDREDRSQYGQFFTPSETAVYLAACFTDSSFSDLVCLHDPGAGSGILTAAFVESLLERVSEQRIAKPTQVTLLASEQDAHFLPALRYILKLCQQHLEAADIPTTIIIKEADWITLSAEALEDSLLPSHTIPPASHVIINPPYKKLASSSPQRRLLSRIGIETTNLYSAFVWLGMQHLINGGELCAITPRSFCNGPYFKPFRKAILAQSHIHLLHQIESRSDLFQRDKVLQENIIYLLEKKHLSAEIKPNQKITLASGSFASPVKHAICLHDAVHPNDPESFIHLATEPDAHLARDFVMNQPASLQDLGIKVSTGPVVDYRMRDDLSHHSHTKNSFPLVYPHLLRQGKVLPPPAHSDDAENVRQRKKPVAIVETDNSSKFLISRGYYVLTKRFTSKEEKRRIVACVLDPHDFPKAKIGIENHINYFHANGAGLSREIAYGLADYLNTLEVDQYFRQFNGHTQVNATDLRTLRYPSEAQLTHQQQHEPAAS